MNCELGATNRLERKPETPSSHSRVPWPRTVHLDVRALEAAALGQPPGDAAHEGQGRQGQHVQQAPALLAEVGQAAARPRTRRRRTPRPSPSRLIAQAREPAGISSTVMMLATTSTATAQPRASTWVAASHGSDGLSAPVAARTQPPATAPSSTARRPRRSASASSPSAIRPPRRTDAARQPLRAVARAELLARERDGLGEQRVEVAEHHRDRRRGCRASPTPRASRRWGGIHHGFAVSGRRMADSNGLRTSHAK